VPWSLNICPTQRSPVHQVQTHGTSNQDTHLYPPHNNSLVYLTKTTYVRRSGRIINGMRSGRTIPQASALSSLTLTPTPGNDPPKKSLGSGLTASAPVLDISHTCLYKWGMASSAACECGAEEQTVDHVVLQCPIHRPPSGLHGLTVLDDETNESLLNTCHEI